MSDRFAITDDPLCTTENSLWDCVVYTLDDVPNMVAHWAGYPHRHLYVPRLDDARVQALITGLQETEWLGGLPDRFCIGQMGDWTFIDPEWLIGGLVTRGWEDDDA